MKGGVLSHNFLPTPDSSPTTSPQNPIQRPHLLTIHRKPVFLLNLYHRPGEPASVQRGNPPVGILVRFLAVQFSRCQGQVVHVGGKLPLDLGIGPAKSTPMGLRRGYDMLYLTFLEGTENLPRVGTVVPPLQISLNNLFLQALGIAVIILIVGGTPVFISYQQPPPQSLCPNQALLFFPLGVMDFVSIQAGSKRGLKAKRRTKQNFSKPFWECF